MKKSKVTLCIILVLLMILQMPASVMANTFNEEIKLFGINDVVSVNSFTELQAELDKGTEEIKLSGDISSLSKNLSVSKSVVIYGQNHSVNLEQGRIDLKSGGKITIYNAKINTLDLGDVLKGFLCVNSGAWEIEFHDLEFNGSVLVGKSSVEAAEKVGFYGNANITVNSEKNFDSVVFAKDIEIANDGNDKFSAVSLADSTFFKSNPQAETKRNFVVSENAFVNITRKYKAGEKNLIEGFDSYNFKESSTFYASAKTNRTYTIVLAEGATAVIRSNSAANFVVEDNAKVELISDASGNVNENGFASLILGKASSGLNMTVGNNAELSLKSTGTGGRGHSRGYAVFSILGNGNSDIEINGTTKISSNSGNGWYYQFGHSGNNNLIVGSGGAVDIFAGAGGAVGATEYAAFEAYGQAEMNIVVKDGGKMFVQNNGYRGMSLAGNGSYARKNILVDGKDSILQISGSTWAIAAETQPTLTVEAKNGGKIYLATSGDVLATMASSTVYSVGPTTYNVDGEGSEIKFEHNGGAYSALFHDGYGILKINITNGGLMDVYNFNTQLDFSARRAAITAQSTNGYKDTDGNETENQIFISGYGSMLNVINKNPLTHGNGGDTGLYPTGAISFNSSALGSVIIENGGNFNAESNSLAPTIHLYNRTLTLDNPGTISIINQSTDGSTDANSSYSTIGQAISNYRTSSNPPLNNRNNAIYVVNSDIEVWNLKGNTNNWDMSSKINDWKNVTFDAKDGNTVEVLGGVSGNTFTLNNYGRINGKGTVTNVNPADVYAEKTSENKTSTDGKTRVNDVLEYTIKAGNSGAAGSVWKEVTITDTLPEGVTLVESSVKVDGIDVAYTYDNRTLTVELGDISGGEGKVLTFDVTVDKDAYGKTIKNSATVSGKDKDGEDVDKEIEENGKNEVESPADVYAEKTSENKTSTDGKTRVNDVLEYTIKAGNSGAAGSVWKEVTITDTLPEGVTLVESSVKVDGIDVAYTYDNGTLTVELGDISGGEGKVLTFDVTVDKDAYGKTIKNSATVSGKDKDGKDVDKEIEENGKNEVESPADVYAEKTSENKTSTDGKTRVNDVLEYTIKAGNSGATGSVWKEVTITDTLPEGVTLVESSVKVDGIDVAYTYDNGTLTVGLGDISGGEGKVLTFDVTVDKDAYGKTIKNSATVSGKDKDGEDVDKEIEENGKNEVESPADVYAEKTSENKTSTDGKTRVNDVLEYTIRAGNSGAAGSVWYGVKITDKLPEDVTLVKDSIKIVKTSLTGSIVTGSAVTGSAYSFNSVTKTLTADLGNIESGDEFIIIFRVKVNSDAYGKTIINTALAEGANEDGKDYDLEPKDTIKVEEKEPGGGNLQIPKKDLPLTELERSDHFAYIMGYPENDIRPLNQITREEVAMIFYRLLTDESRNNLISDENSFTDIEEYSWSNRAISTLYKAGILMGYEDGTLRPSNPITRAEFAAIASRFASIEETSDSIFTDIGDHWAEDLINSAAKKGWIKGYEDSTFRPDNNITRAEAMSMINNVLGRKVVEENIHPDAKQWIDNLKGTWYYEIVMEATYSHNYILNKNGNELWIELKANKIWP